MSNTKTNSKKSSTKKQQQSKYLTSLELKNINDYLDKDIVFINFKKEFDKEYVLAQKRFDSPIKHLRHSFENEVIILNHAIESFLNKNDFSWIFTKPINHNDRWWKVKLFMDLTPKEVDTLDNNFDRVTRFLTSSDTFIDRALDGRSIDYSILRRYRESIGEYDNYVTYLDGENNESNEYYNLFAPFHSDFWEDDQRYLSRDCNIITPRQALQSGYIHNFSYYVMRAADISKGDIERTDDYKSLSEYTPFHHAPVVCKRNGLDYTDPENLSF